jgi:peptidoglycan/xylan/chitin deacetylase (PgdA/CDA1 family)
MSRKALYLRVTLGLCGALFLWAGALGQQASGPTAAGGREPFRWPAGKQAAVSLTFDDARLSQIDTALALLDKYGIKVTFYVSVDNLEKRLEGWKRAVASGHEIGNHSSTHPCTGNYEFSLKNALEDYTLPMMEKELDGASADIQRLLGVTPVTFAYPCGQKFVGRGREVKSYVPLVAERFIVGRGYLDEAANDPAFCDLAQATGRSFDDLNYEQVKKLAMQARQQGRWLILVGHEIGAPAFQTTDAAALEALCQYARDPANGLWVDTVAAIGKYIREQRSAKGK